MNNNEIITYKYNDMDSSLSKIDEITTKNQVNKIIKAYKNYKVKYSQCTSQRTNSSQGIQKNTLDYIGNRDSKGQKTGFGIQKNPDGSKIIGQFSNDKLNGWSIFKSNDGVTFKGEYEDNRTSGYGEYSNNDKVVYYGELG